MTDHTTSATRLPLGSDGYAGWSGAVAGFRVAVAARATANGAGVRVGNVSAPSAPIAA